MKSPLPCGTQFLRKWFPQGNPHKLLFGRRGSYLSRTASQMGDTAARADTPTFHSPLNPLADETSRIHWSGSFQPVWARRVRMAQKYGQAESMQHLRVRLYK